jgi:hypothetical protein
MSQYRIPAESSKYYVEKELYLTTVHFCRQYPSWLAELSIQPDTSKAITYDKERVQTSVSGDTTAEIAIRRAELSRKVKLVDDTASFIAGTMDKWLILGVCYGIPFYQLLERGIPCGKDLYYNMRRKFYHEMAQRI